MRDVSFGQLSVGTARPVLAADDLDRQVKQLWLLWHRSPMQRSEVGRSLPALIRGAHASIRATDGNERRHSRSATADLYRLVQRLLAHICEPELHALAVERGRALSEEADSPLSLAQAAWASSVGLCASGYYEEAAHLADCGTNALLAACGDDLTVAAMGTVGALHLEAAAAHGLGGGAAGRARHRRRPRHYSSRPPTKQPTPSGGVAGAGTRRPATPDRRACSAPG